MRKRNKKVSAISISMFIIAMILVFSLPVLYEKIFVKGYHEHGSYRYNLTENFDKQAIHVGMGEGIIVDDLNEIRFCDYEGNILWRRSINSKNSILAASENLAVLADSLTGDLFTLDQNGNIRASLYGLGKIEKIKVFDNKYIAVQLSTHQIVVFDQILNEKGRVDTLDGNLLDFIIDTKNELLIFSSFWVNESNFHTMITSAELNGDVIAGNIIDARIGYRLLPNDNGVFVITENSVILYPFDGSEKKEIIFDEKVAHIFVNDQNAWFNLIIENPDIDETRALNRIVKFDVNGNIVQEIPISSIDFTSMTCDDDNIYLINDNEVKVMNSDGAVIQTIVLDKNFESVSIYAKSYIGLTYNNHSKIMKLH